MKVKLNDVRVTKLNGTCLTLIVKFSRVLKNHNGVVLQLSDPGIVREIIAHASKTSNPQLRKICNRLIREIRSHLNGEPTSTMRYAVYQKADDAVADDTRQKNYRIV